MTRPTAVLAFALLLAGATPLAAQLPDRIERQAARSGYVNLSGPRFGALWLGGDQDKIRSRYDVDRVISQLGIALEQRFFAVPEGPTGVVQLVALAGAADQGEFIPSGMLLFGLRSQGGLEIAMGPWFAERDAAAVVQVGAVVRAGYMRIPLTVQVMPSSDGTRVGFLTGFNAFR
jgi:hypothetical protein